MCRRGRSAGPHLRAGLRGLAALSGWLRTRAGNPGRGGNPGGSGGAALYAVRGSGMVSAPDKPTR